MSLIYGEGSAIQICRSADLEMEPDNRVAPSKKKSMAIADVTGLHASPKGLRTDSAYMHLIHSCRRI